MSKLAGMWLESTQIICLMFQHGLECTVSYYGETQHGMLPFMCHGLVTFNVRGGYILRPENVHFHPFYG